MTQMKYMLYLFIFIAFFLNSCQKRPEQQVYDEILKIEDNQQQCNALIGFLKDYPQSKNKDRVLYRLFRNYVEMNNEAEALEYGHSYIYHHSPESRMSPCNAVSWTLAENDLGADSALVWAFNAVQLAQKNDPRRLRMILDTYAFTLYRSGDFSEAVKAQLEASIGHENDPEYIFRLGLYQHADGKLQDALYTMAKTIYFGGGAESVENFNSWINEIDDSAKQKKLAKEVVDKVLDESYTDLSDLDQKSSAAILLGLTGVDLETAEKWANQAVQALQPNDNAETILSRNLNLALVLKASNKTDLVMDLLNSIEQYASPYSFDYWRLLGDVYIGLDQREKALESYATGLMAYEDANLLNAAHKAGFSGQEIETKINLKKSEIENFHPGKFDSAAYPHSPAVLAELFTGAECNPCVAADLAFDLLADYYPKNNLVILEYHLHIPGADPLTNNSSENRYEYYGRNFGTPTMFINGTDKSTGGGSAVLKKYYFDNLSKRIESQFDKNHSVSIDLSANKTGDNIIAEININTERNMGKSTVFVALAEKSVDYTGANGISKHAFVVRKMKEFAFTPSEKYTVNFDIAEIQTELETYLNNFEAAPPTRFRGFSGFRAKPYKMDDTNLCIIAWLQDNTTLEVYNTIYKELN